MLTFAIIYANFLTPVKFTNYVYLFQYHIFISFTFAQKRARLTILVINHARFLN